MDIAFSDPTDPNYFRLSDIVKIRGALSDLGAWFEDGGSDEELAAIATDMQQAAWTAKQAGFDPALEADRIFLAQLDRSAPVGLGGDSG